MTDPGSETPKTPPADRAKAGRSTTRETESGLLFTTHQRTDLRWFFRIDGKDSETTYPTAGEAERGALAALKAAAKNRPEPWKWWLIIAAASAPIIYFVAFLVRLITNR